MLLHNALRTAGLLVGLSGTIVLGCWLFGGPWGLQLGVVIVIALNGLVVFFGDRMTLHAMHARPVSEIERPELYRLVRELATAARQPMPRIYLSPTAAPNAFALGHTPRSGAVCCTTGLLRLLNERELRGVLAHELTHIRNRDTLACSVAATVATFITSLTALALLLPLGDSEDEDVPSLLGALLFLVLGPTAAMVVRVAISRRKEYRADEAAAELTGDPIALANALRKIEIGARVHALPAERRLLAAGHLMIAPPFDRKGMSRLFCAHPPTTERIRRLRTLADRWDASS